MNPDEKKKVTQKAKTLHDHLVQIWGMQPTISGATQLSYENALVQYAKQKQSAINEGIEFVLDIPNKNSRTVFTAAIRRSSLARLLAAGQAETVAQAMQIMRDVTEDLQQVDAMLARQKSAEKSSKFEINLWTMRIAGLEKIYPDWRDRLQRKMAQSKYAACFAVQRASGCRTEELIRGVLVTKVAEGEYQIHINTAKQRAANTDNRVRIIKSFDQALEAYVGEVKLPVELGVSDSDLDKAKAIAKAKNNYKQTMSNTSKRLFGLSITPKAFRSCMASDLRAAGASTVGVAEFLGHASTACANRYSRGLNVRGKARTSPAVLESARVKVQPKSISKSLLDARTISAAFKN